MACMSWVLTILGIVALIVLHEFGHFTVAKLVGMRVERFSLFFPPTIFKIKRGETEYAIGAIPAGGYVKITGMNPEELEGLDPEVTRRAYYSQPPWKRIAVILAGPGVNVLIAFVLFAAVLVSGNANGSLFLERINPSLDAYRQNTSLLEIEKGGVAAGVLRSGDRIVAIDGGPVTPETARTRIGEHICAAPLKDGCRAATPALVTVQRGKRTLSVRLFPRYNEEAGRMLLGVAFGSVKPFGVGASAAGAVSTMWNATTETLTGFVKSLTSAKKRGELSSIVGITQDAHETVVAGPGNGLVFLGYISLVLAVINLFPFLPLDGGHIVWSLAEKLRGKRISVGAMYRYSSVGIVLLLFLVINGVSNDIGRLGG
jgi:regulator of sigma E protease